MYPVESRGRPVFLSFSGVDRTAALRLRDSFLRRGVEAFVDEVSIPPGPNLVLAINKALEESDYFVLLWSQHTVNKRWVEAEWSAALYRHLNGHRCHLFIVTMDETPLPAILLPFTYVAARGDWDAVAARLVDVWRRDRAIGLPVLPAPSQPATGTASIRLCVRNRDLAVAHVIMVPERTTGGELMVMVCAALELKPAISHLNGQVGVRFSYRLEKDGRPIPADETLGPPVLTESSVIDLLVQVEWFGPKGPLTDLDFRGGEAGELNPAMMRTLLNSAFGHLIPRSRTRRRRRGSAS